MRKILSKACLQTGLFSFDKISLLLLLLVLAGFRLSAQEIFSVYYPSGDHKLLFDNKQEINKFIFAHDLKQIDSLQVIGFADSTGNRKLNLKLSQKRAEKVKNYLLEILPEHTSVRSFARGEENAVRNPNENHRRVEIHLFYSGKVIEDSADRYEYFGDTKTCFVLSDSIMKNCNIIRVDDGRTSYVILEMEPHLFSKDQQYYTLAKNSQSAKVVRWNLEVSGDGWWKHERYRAQVKAADFDAYGILTRKEIRADYNECVVCEEDMDKALKLTSELLPEVFVMQNLQLRRKRLEGEYLLIVPQEYITPGKKYYFDRNYDHPVVWGTKPGIRNRPYFFATVPAEYLESKEWNIYSNHSICIPAGDSLEISYPPDTLKPHRCLPETRGGINALDYGLEAGYWNLDARSAYLAAYIQYSGTHLEYSANVGIDLKARILAGLKADYLLFSYSPFKQLIIGNANRSMIHDFHPTLAAYAGTNLNFVGNQASPGLVQAIYLGVTYKNNPFSLSFDRFYTNLGISTDYLRPGGLNFSLYLQLGVKLKI